MTIIRDYRHGRDFLEIPGPPPRRRKALGFGTTTLESIYIWVNYNDLTTTSLEIMVSKGNHPQMAARFRLVKYYNLPRFMDYRYPILNPLVGGLEHFLFFHILRMSSSQLTFLFFRGVGQPPTSPPFTSGFLPSHVLPEGRCSDCFLLNAEFHLGTRAKMLGFGMMKKHPLVISIHWTRGIPKGRYFLFFSPNDVIRDVFYHI